MLTQNFLVEENYHKERLDIFLTHSLENNKSRSFIKKAIEHGHVLVNDDKTKANYKVQTNDKVTLSVPDDFLHVEDIKPENIPLKIIYQDDDLAVIDKPSGLLVHPTGKRVSGTLVNGLLFHFDQLSDLNTDERPGIVHRLDEDTSGIIVIAKNNTAHAKLARQFKKHEMKKKYVALVEGKVEFDEGEIDVPLMRDAHHREKRIVSYDQKAKKAYTFYKVIKRSDQCTYVEMMPTTGRTHQLRVHMKHIRHSILGDVKYGHANNFSRLALHAQSIVFTHPTTKQEVSFESPVPIEFLDKVGLNS